MRKFRLITVLVLLVLSSHSAVAGWIEDGGGNYPYAINLASSNRQFTTDDLPKLEVVHAYRVYTASFVKDGKTWNRLRLGFFGSLSEANTVLDELKPHYPDAWIAEVAAGERLNSSGAVLATGKPRTIDEAGTSPTRLALAGTDHGGEDDSGTVTSPPEASQPSERLALAGADYGSEDESGTVPSLQETSQPSERLALAGADYGGENAYYYVGLLVPFPGSNLGNGFVQRYWVDWLQYEYESSNQTIKAEALGASVALGYGKAAAKGAWSVYLGPVWRDTSLSPDDRGSDVRGAQWGMSISLQGDRRIGDDWRVNGIASFTTSTDSYWTRGRVTKKLLSGYAAGLEAVFHGNDDYSAWQAGAVLLDIRLAPQASMGLKCGARKSSGEDMGAYIGIELARSF